MPLACAVAHQQLQIPIVLVGNKADLIEERVVKTVDAEAFAKKHNIGFLEGMAPCKQDISFTELTRCV